jgi:hypothetical protein
MFPSFLLDEILADLILVILLVAMIVRIFKATTYMICVHRQEAHTILLKVLPVTLSGLFPHSLRTGPRGKMTSPSVMTDVIPH